MDTTPMFPVTLHQSSGKAMIMDNNIIDLTAQIVSAHIGANDVSADQLPALIRQVHQALSSVDQALVEQTRGEPVVSAKKSVFADHLVCMDCGKSFKMLKRHLSADHGMTPEQYRLKWGLPSSYSMVAADYASVRSQLAKDTGLGRKPAEQPAPKKRGRPRKT